MENTGIYKIVSTKNNRTYVGSAVNIKRRWSRHKRDLLKNVHHSRFLQRHYNKYGLEDLTFSVLEFCKKEELIVREQHFLNTLKCPFNSAPIAGSCIGVTRTEEFKKKLSKLNSGKGNPTYGLTRTKEWRENISKANMGQKAWNKGKVGIYNKNTLCIIKEKALSRERAECEHCREKVTPQNYARWHGEKCKQKGIKEGYKKCAKCGLAKPLDAFSKNKRQLDKHEARCKNCRKKVRKILIKEKML